MFQNWFNPENSFWEFMNNVTNVLFIGLIWFVFCLPIITIGASTTALYDYTLKLAANAEGYVIKSFFQSFKKNFAKATLIWLLILLGIGFLTLDAYICLAMGNTIGNILFFAILALGIIFLIISIYVFPVLAFFHTNIKDTFKNACLMGIARLPLTLLILIIFGIGALITYSVPYLIFALGGFTAYVSSYCYLSVFRKYTDSEIQ